jgi:lycopene cyclase CruP
MLPQVGIPALLDWSVHYFNLALYNGLYPIGKSLKPLTKKMPSAFQYYYYRWLQAWQYGAGRDYHQ